MRQALTVLLLLSAPALYAESRVKRFWIASVAAVGASTSADILSSVGKHELNPVLRSSSGTFGARGISLKLVIVGGMLGGQYLLQRRSPTHSTYQALTAANVGISIVTGHQAWRNMAVSRVR